MAGAREHLPSRRSVCPSRGDSGAVLLETALAIPVLLAVAAALAWCLSLAVTTAALGDAARTVARELARGQAPDAALGSARAALPAARVVIRQEGDLVVVVAEQDVSAPVPIIDGLAITLRQSVSVPREWSGS